MKQSAQGKRPSDNFIFAVSLASLIMASYAWRLWVIDAFPLIYDEGIHLIIAKLWAAGYAPYQEVFISYPPSFIWSLGLPWKIFNSTGAVQLVMASYALAGVIATVYLAAVYNSRLAGIAAGLFLSFSPAYFVASFSIMTEIPSIGVAVVAIAFAEKYRRSGSWGWLTLVGSSLAVGLSLKVLPFYAIPFVGLIAIARFLPVNAAEGFRHQLQSSWSTLARDLLILAASFIIVFLAPLVFFDLPAFYEQVIGMRLVSRETQVNPFESNNRDIIGFLFSNPGVMILALYGLVFVVARNLRDYWLLIVWFVLIWVSMYFHVPLRDKHLPIFLPVLAIFAGFGVNHMYYYLRHFRQVPVTPASAAMVLAILIVLVMVAWNVPLVIAENNGDTAVVSINEAEQNAIAFIRTISTPDDCVIADDPVFLFQTERLPPPELSETTKTRIETGYLTLEDIIRSIQRHQCHVVAVVTGRFGETIPGLPDWLTNNYLGHYGDDEVRVFFAKKGVDQADVDVVDTNFGDMVRLVGSRVEPAQSDPERAGYLSLYWRLEAPLEDRFQARISLRPDRANELPPHEVTHPLFAGHVDPEEWQIGEAARDTFLLDLPSDLSAGEYELYLALCSIETQTCLKIDGQPLTEYYLDRIVVQPDTVVIEP